MGRRKYSNLRNHRGRSIFLRSWKNPTKEGLRLEERINITDATRHKKKQKTFSVIQLASCKDITIERREKERNALSGSRNYSSNNKGKADFPD